MFDINILKSLIIILIVYLAKVKLLILMANKLI